MSYKTELQGNNTDLQAILDTVNALPEASTGPTLIEVTMITEESCSLSYYDENRNQVNVPQNTTVTAKVLGGFIFNCVCPDIPSATGDYLMPTGTFVYVFLSDGGTLRLNY